MYSGGSYSTKRGGGTIVLLVIAVILAGGAGYYFLLQPPPGPSTVAPVDPDTMAAPEDAPDTGDLLLPPDAPRLPGARLYGQGKYDEAEAELESYLATGTPEETVQASYVLAMAKAKLRRTDEARQMLRTISEENRASPYAASALVALASLHAGPDARDDARALLDRAWMSHPRSPAGAHAGMLRGDELFAEHAAKGREQHKHWSRIRDAYSVALRGLRSSPARARLVERLTRLNEYLIFNPRTDFSGSVFVEIEPGETISHLAVAHDSTMGLIARINRLKSTTIHPGQRLKIVGGKPSIVVDKRHLRLTLWLDDGFLAEYPIGIGPGEETPPGRFTIASRVENPNWYRRGKPVIEFGHPDNILGTRWLGFRQSGPGMGIGIHGSPDGKGVGERVSAGCIRMHNADVEELFDMAPSGTVINVIE